MSSLKKKGFALDNGLRTPHRGVVKKEGGGVQTPSRYLVSQPPPPPFPFRGPIDKENSSTILQSSAKGAEETILGPKTMSSTQASKVPPQLKM